MTRAFIMQMCQISEKRGQGYTLSLPAALALCVFTEYHTPQTPGCVSPSHGKSVCIQGLKSSGVIGINLPNSASALIWLLSGKSL